MKKNSFILLVGLFLFAGCAQKPQTLYYWGNYQPEVYTHLQGEGKGVQEQIASLDETMQKASAEGKQLPPGYHAHLALLHLENGHLEQFKNHLETEKALFPESRGYIDFLLKEFKK